MLKCHNLTPSFLLKPPRRRFRLMLPRNTFLVIEGAPGPYLSRWLKIISGATRLDVPDAFCDPICIMAQNVFGKRCRGGGWASRDQAVNKERCKYFHCARTGGRLRTSGAGDRIFRSSSSGLQRRARRVWRYSLHRVHAS